MDEIILVRGDTLRLWLESIRTADGDEYTLSDTDAVFIDLKKEEHPDSTFISRRLTAADYSEEGLPIVLYPDETAVMPIGNYIFDIRLVMDGENVYTIVPVTRLKIILNITDIPGGG